MRKILVPIVLLSLAVFSSTCDDNKEVKEFSKDGAIETIMNVDHLDSLHDIIITTHNVWVKNQLIKKIVSRDTIPNLGLTSQVAENNEGNAKIVSLKKEYEIYITVK